MTRFDLDMDGSMEPSEHGRWVRYEDAQAREWVGLTDEEISDLWCEVSNTDFVTADTHVFASAIEAKLKEKNT